MAAGSPTVDGTIIPNHPWHPSGPALSARIPLMIGWTHTEETWYQRPTPENLAMTESGMRALITKRLGAQAEPVIAAFKAANPQATPYDLNILITTEHPRAATFGSPVRANATQAALTFAASA